MQQSELIENVNRERAMPTVFRTVLVSHSPQQMFDLINDIESYPEFMTGCVRATILHADSNCIEARLTLGLAGLKQSFVTRNELTPPTSMTMHLIEGPFSHFDGLWSFEELTEPKGNQGCRISLRLTFAFRNRLLGIALEKMIEEITNRQVDALCRRADAVYGAY